MIKKKYNFTVMSKTMTDGNSGINTTILSP